MTSWVHRSRATWEGLRGACIESVTLNCFAADTYCSVSPDPIAHHTAQSTPSSCGHERVSVARSPADARQELDGGDHLGSAGYVDRVSVAQARKMAGWSPELNKPI